MHSDPTPTPTDLHQPAGEAGRRNHGPFSGEDTLAHQRHVYRDACAAFPAAHGRMGCRPRHPDSEDQREGDYRRRASYTAA
jgi:hypothetical protein